MWQRGLPSTGLPAWVPQPSQKSKTDYCLDFLTAFALISLTVLLDQDLTPALFIIPQPSTSSVTSDEKVDYVQVDKEKTQALQSTMQEWTDVRQSTEPAKGVKS